MRSVARSGGGGGLDPTCRCHGPLLACRFWVSCRKPPLRCDSFEPHRREERASRQLRNTWSGGSGCRESSSARTPRLRWRRYSGTTRRIALACLTIREHISKRWRHSTPTHIRSAPPIHRGVHGQRRGPRAGGDPAPRSRRRRDSGLLRLIPADTDIIDIDSGALATGSAVSRFWDVLRRGGDGLGRTKTSKLIAAKRPRPIPIWDSFVQQVTGLDTED